MHVALELGHLARGEVQVVHAQLTGLAQDVVIDVGHVAHAARLVAGVAQPTLEDVEGQVHEGVAEVGRVVGRDAAAVERDERTRLHLEDAASSSVVEAHQLDSPARRT